MRNLTLLLVVLALYGLMLIFGANVLARSTYNAAVLDCTDDDDSGDDASRTVVWCDKDQTDDASRTVFCGGDDDDSSESS